MPYREMPRGVEARPGDPPALTKAIEHRSRFGRLDVGGLWPAPADQLFDAESIEAFCVSADGLRALLCTREKAWLLDTRTMTSPLSIALPCSPSVCALNANGTRAALVCDEDLYRWEFGEQAEPGALEAVWSSEGLSGSEVLELSRDGRVAITSHYSQGATVRVFDLEIRTMTHSFRSDADECLLLHPGGRHLISFGDDAIARLYGRDGLYGKLHKTTGGAFSPDGKMLIVNCMDKHKEVRLYSIDADGAELLLGPERCLHLRREVDTWNCKARFAPSGSQVLIGGGHGRTHRIDIASGDSIRLPTGMGRHTAMLADESQMLLTASARDFGVHGLGLAIQDAKTGEISGILCATGGEDAKLVGVTRIGVYGSVESDAPIANELALPYERPSLISQLLRQSGASLDRKEQLRLDEVHERRSVWQQHLAALTADITLRDLMAVNRGLIELTSEIVERARLATNHDDTPRFGAHQVNLVALKSAAAELTALSLGARQEAFSQMVTRMRQGSGAVQRGGLVPGQEAPVQEAPVREAPVREALSLYDDSGEVDSGDLISHVSSGALTALESMAAAEPESEPEPELAIERTMTHYGIMGAAGFLASLVLSAIVYLLTMS